VIPSLGRPELSHTLHSIRKQTDDDFETIVVYDGIDIENKEDDKNVFFINIHKSSKGAGPVRNAAIPFITTEWTAFVDDDDTLSDSYVKDLKYFSSIFPESDLIVFRLFDTKNENNIIPTKITKDTFSEGDVGISFAVKTNILKKIQFRDMHAEDFDFIKRSVKAGYTAWLTRYINYFVRFVPSDDEKAAIKENENELCTNKIINVV
jgi:glycosyltransferase involved in cell wall biosynthesis